MGSGDHSEGAGTAEIAELSIMAASASGARARFADLFMRPVSDGVRFYESNIDS